MRKKVPSQKSDRLPNKRLKIRSNCAESQQKSQWKRGNVFKFINKNKSLFTTDFEQISQMFTNLTVNLEYAFAS